MKIGDRQQFGLALSEPFCGSRPLTLWAMTVATRVVRDARVRAVLTALDMTAERGSAARLNCRHGAKLAKAQMTSVPRSPCLTVAAEDVRHLQLRPEHGGRVKSGESLRRSEAQAGFGFAEWC
jgi:hypothetical protein